MTKHVRLKVSVAITLCCLLFPGVALAGSAGPGGILADFSQASSSWSGPALSYGMDIFAFLATIEFAWTWILYILEKGGGEDDPIPILIRKILSLGFFYWLLANGPMLIGTLIDGFIYLAEHIGAMNGTTTPVTIGNHVINILSPDWIFHQGVQIATNLDSAAMAHTSIWHPINTTFISIVVGLAMLIVVAAFAIIAANIIITLIEAFIVVGAGLVFLGFGGSRWTLPFMEKYIGYAVSVGVKLFILYLVVAFGSTLSSQWVTLAKNAGGDAVTYFTIGLDAVIYMFIAWKVPDFASSLMNGTPQASLGGAMQTVSGLGMAAAGVGAAALTGGASLAATAGGAGAALAGGVGAAGNAMATAGRAGLEAVGHVGQGFSAGGMAGAMSGLGDVGAAMGGMARDAASSSVSGLAEKYQAPKMPESTQLGGRLSEVAASKGWGGGGPGGSGGQQGKETGNGQGATAAKDNAGNNATAKAGAGNAPASAAASGGDSPAASGAPGGSSAGGGLADAVASEAAGSGAVDSGTPEQGNMGANDTGADSAAQDSANEAATQGTDAGNTQAEERIGTPPPQTDGVANQGGSQEAPQNASADNSLGAGDSGADSAAQDANNATDTANQDQANTADTNKEAGKADNVVDLKTARNKGRTPGRGAFEYMREANEALPSDQGSAGSISIRLDME